MKKISIVGGMIMVLVMGFTMMNSSPKNIYAQEIETNCFDNIDNDDDFMVDFADSDCEGSLPYENTYDQCHDDIDNDDDFFIDYADPDCQPFINLKVKNNVQKHVQKKDVFAASSMEYVQCKKTEKDNIKVKSDRCNEKNGK